MKRKAAAASVYRSRMRWDEAQDAVVRKSYPDYGEMVDRLPHRSLAALKHRAANLGIVRRRHVWKQTEVRKLTRLVSAGVVNAELIRAFPELRQAQITSKIRHLKLPPRRPDLAVFEDVAIQEVRRRALLENITLVELDRRAGTGRYFQKSARRLLLGYVARAAAVFGGEIRFEWESL